MPSTPYTPLLSQAESTTTAALLNSSTYRAMLTDRQTRKSHAYAHLQALRHKSKAFEFRISPKHFHTLLCRHLETSILTTTLTAEVREAAELLVVREKELRQARSEENEIRISHDTCLVKKGKLRSIPPPASNSDSPLQIWRREVEQAFTSYTHMASFPSPPPLREGATHTVSCADRPQHRLTHVCSNRCKGHPTVDARELRRQRPIEACECAVRAAFQGCDVNLRVERLRWSPERFNVRFQRRAKYVFGIVEEMYQAVRKA
ncbi:hypothetical protein LTR10_006292 [Elasticomyces elasticus]|nr:hypothetical protein LTR10_006292 [Elasticomyces elasticus]KAK4966658.1 hypothetical protein LTR42_010969 [Elasticomyces elasticus]